MGDINQNFLNEKKGFPFMQKEHNVGHDPRVIKPFVVDITEPNYYLLAAENIFLEVLHSKSVQ